MTDREQSDGVVWLASYPKAGNTWMRLMLMHLLHPPRSSWTLDSPIWNGGNLPIKRRRLEALCLIDTSMLTPGEFDQLNPCVVNAASQHVTGTVFYKTHDAYRFTPDGVPVLGNALNQKAIYLVRDPRDVALSLAEFWGKSVQSTVDTMNDPEALLSGSRRKFTPQVVQKLTDWSGHVRSWLDQNQMPVLLVPYEHLRQEPLRWLSDVLDFVGIAATASQMEKAVRLTQFERLQKEEREHGFSEYRERPGVFFRRARPGEWRGELSPDLVAAIERAHGPTMERLGYRCVSTVPQQSTIANQNGTAIHDHRINRTAS